MNALPSNAVPIDVVYRAWAEKVEQKKRYHAKKTGRVEPVEWALVFDTETTIDTLQNLTFGFYRLVRYSAGTVQTAIEGILYADDLEETDPSGFNRLRSYAMSKRADVPRNTIDGVTPNRNLQFLSRDEFVERVLFAAIKNDTPIVGFNLPFDLSRIAVGYADSVGYSYGGFTLYLYRDDDTRRTWRPGIVVKHLDSKKSFIKVTAPSKRQKDVWRAPGRFIDLRTLTFALSNVPHSLASACREWNVEAKASTSDYGEISGEFIEYARQDVLSTAHLLGATLDHFYELGINLQPNKAYSPASIAKACLREMGVQGPLSRQPDFPREVLGAAMQAFYGGRAEVNVRRMHLPVAVHDFTSMYPSVNSLMGLWSFLTAERIDVFDTTDETQALLESLTLDDLYNQATWRKVATLVLIKPDGDILPVRGKYGRGGTANIGVNPLWSDRPVWYSLADVIASKLLSGSTATLLQALTLKPSGAADVKAATLTGLTIDPKNGDFFRSLIELRKQQPDQKGRTAGLLKVLANSGSYGIFSEFNAEEHPPSHDPTSVSVWRGDSTASVQRVPKPEIPGTYCFPPIAAFITGAARLMLAMFETEVVQRGGTWTFCDTDSLSVVSTERGGLILCPGGTVLNDAGEQCIYALPWSALAEIRARFDTELNPYDRALVRSLVKLEEDKSGINFAVSAKRYATYRLTDDGAIILSDAKEHGLGHVKDPRPDTVRGFDESRNHPSKWTDDLWLEVLQRDLEPSHRNELWSGMPALKTVSVTSPHVMRRFRQLNKEKQWKAQVKPFNFVTTTSTIEENHLTQLGIHSHPMVTGLIAPFVGNPRDAESAEWLLPDGTLAGPVVIGRSVDGCHRLQCMDTIVTDHVRSPEVKRLPPRLPNSGGWPMLMNAGTIGLLQRTPTVASRTSFIGKEANQVEAIDDFLVNASDVRTDYHEDERLTVVLQILRTVPVTLLFNEVRDRMIASDVATLVSQRALRDILRQGSTRNRVLSDLLLDIAADEAVSQLAHIGIARVVSSHYQRSKGQDNRTALVSLWVAHGSPNDAPMLVAKVPVRLCLCGCGERLTGKASFAGSACRQRASRASRKTKNQPRK